MIFSERKRAGFTLVEMLVVIGVIGILAASLLSAFGHVRRSARKAQAQTLVSEAATAFTLCLQQEREWPTELRDKTEMDEEVCRYFQEHKLLDVTPYKFDSNGKVTTERNMRSVDRFGLLDPTAQLVLKRSTSASPGDKMTSGRAFKDYRLQYRLDKNLDGFVDGSEGAPKGVRVRAAVLVWSRGSDGLDDFDQPGRYPRDDSLSWQHAQFGSGQ